MSFIIWYQEVGTCLVVCLIIIEYKEPRKHSYKLEMCPVGTRMPRQGVMSVTQNDFGEMIYR